MPSPAIAQSLFSLLPSITSPPPRLFNLCESLLALSRQRASHLKPEEEIARAYACCEIACDRLQAPLRLPPTKKNAAPCKPVVYRKLLRFLENVLGEDASVTPGKRKRAAMSDEIEIQETPIKKVRQTPNFTPVKSTGKKENRFVGRIKAQSANVKEHAKEAPSFVMPGIRRLCKMFRTPEMAPHVYTGTCVVLKLADLWPPEDLPAENLEAEVTALIVALYLMVLTRMQQGKMTTKIFRGVSSRAVEMFEAVSETQEIEGWIKRINKEGHCKGQDWWESVPEGLFEFSVKNLEGEDGGVDEDVELEGGKEELDRAETVTLSMRKAIDLEQDDPEGVLLPGLGTMMCDAADWLSEERRAQFQRWKRDLFRQIDRVTAAA